MLLYLFTVHEDEALDGVLILIVVEYALIR